MDWFAAVHFNTTQDLHSEKAHNHNIVMTTEHTDLWKYIAEKPLRGWLHKDMTNRFNNSEAA